LIDGGADSDQVNILTHGSATGAIKAVNYNIKVFDSGASNRGTDRLVVLGTAERDTFLSREGYVALLHGTPEQILANASARPATAERISYNSAIDGGLLVSGLAGDDLFVSDDNSTVMVLDGGEGNDTFLIGQIYGSAPAVGSTFGSGTDGITTTETTRGWVSNGIRYDTLIRGGAGSDTFNVYSNNALLRLEGGDADDSFAIHALLRAGTQTEINRYKANGTVEIVGGAGNDTMRVFGTEGADAFVTAENGVWGAGRSISLSGTEEFIELDAREGDDSIFVQSTGVLTATRIIGDLGSDMVSLSGDVTKSVITGQPSGSGFGGGGFGGSFGGSGVSFADPAATSYDAWILAASTTALGASSQSGALKVFDAGTHQLSALAGAITLDAARVYTLGFRQPVMLKAEAYSGPKTVTITTLETTTNDWVVFYSDGATAGLSGTMRNSTGFDGRQRTLVAGLGMATGAVTLGVDADGKGGLIYQRGVSYSGFETIEVLMGKGDDTFVITDTTATADSTAFVATTVIYGGVGADTITALNVADGTALVIYGDSDTAGLRYSDAVGAKNGNGWLFDATKTASGNGDMIDVSQVTAGAAGVVRVVIDGGTGNDTILGSQGADLIAGGSGNDMISGNGGNDLLFGDSGVWVNLATRAVVVEGVSQITTGKLSADPRTAGADTISGGAGDDLIFGDLGTLESQSGSFRLGQVWLVAAARSTDLAKGGADIIDGGTGNDILVGGFGADRIGPISGGGSDANGNDVLIGDSA
ncbi:MAG: hypothetical protein Q8L76_08040, partial [Cypionkella sp.]|nr:hypothetical protein [Cypionkella sp.]